MRRLLVSLCVCALSIATADARMYQWVNPATGTTQLSGTPPAWYRSAQGGPRVYVFENNRLVDDTAVAVSDEKRAALHAEAFGEAPPAPASSAAPSPPARGDVATAAAPAPTPTTGAAQDPTAKAAALKDLIDAWDQRQLDQARSLLDLMPPPAADAPPATAR